MYPILIHASVKHYSSLIRRLMALRKYDLRMVSDKKLGPKETTDVKNILTIRECPAYAQADLAFDMVVCYSHIW